LIKMLKIPEQTLLNYLSLIEQHYHAEVPYHNSVHAADVTQSAHVLIGCNALAVSNVLNAVNACFNAGGPWTCSRIAGVPRIQRGVHVVAGLPRFRDLCLCSKMINIHYTGSMLMNVASVGIFPRFESWTLQVLILNPQVQMLDPPDPDPGLHGSKSWGPPHVRIKNPINKISILDPQVRILGPKSESWIPYI